MAYSTGDFARRALLPAGLSDTLPPNATHEAAVVETLVASLQSHGYARIKPPLIEFEDSLLDGPGAATSSRVFRLMDPMSQKMMGVRADMTTQVARIASTRLDHMPRPLRLAYAGPVLRTVANPIHPEREVVQVGGELIGSETIGADAEIILVALEALERVGLEHLSVDLMVPQLVPAILDTLELTANQRDTLLTATDSKDIAAVRDTGAKGADLLASLLSATGARVEALAALTKLDLPASAQEEIERLKAVVSSLIEARPNLAITLDPVENRGFEYHVGISFSLFSKSVRGEIGRGGRYHLTGESGETATGFTLYVDRVLHGLPEPVSPPRIYLPFGLSRTEADVLRAAGHITVQGLSPETDASAEAGRLGCTHYFQDGKILPTNEA